MSRDITYGRTFPVRGAERGRLMLLIETLSSGKSKPRDEYAFGKQSS